MDIRNFFGSGRLKSQHESEISKEVVINIVSEERDIRSLKSTKEVLIKDRKKRKSDDFEMLDSDDDISLPKFDDRYSFVDFKYMNLLKKIKTM